MSRTYRFRSIGGTSAEAIAAAATAAAEYGRRHGVSGSFDRLAGLPQELGKVTPGEHDAFLFRLFQPAEATAPLFNVFTSSLRQHWHKDPVTDKVKSDTLLEKGRRALLAGVKNYPLAALVGALPGLVCLTAAVRSPPDPWASLALLVALAVTLLGVPVGVSVGMLLSLARGVTQNYLGVCTGKTQPGSQHPGFTNWFGDYLNELAGTLKGKPLTFGDLRGDDKSDPNITLQMMTTCLTHGVPYLLPFQKDELYFKPGELKDFFPDEVVSWMVRHARSAGRPLPEGMLALPKTEELPVIFAVRLSMSFPLLFSAVPLYARQDENKAPERVWFADGGICSNFPLHFFDSPLPRRPTFAINLRSMFHEDLGQHDPEQAVRDGMVQFPASNREGIKPVWRHFEGRQGLGKLHGFFGAMVETGFTWQETLQATTVPGFRDRIVHVVLDKTNDEGGLNLNMPLELIEELDRRGRQAGGLLVDHYAKSPPSGSDISWDNHRWVRYRNLMNVLSRYLFRFARAYEHRPRHGTPYRDLLDDPPSYKWRSEVQRAFAKGGTEALFGLAEGWRRSEDDPVTKNFQEDAPNPEPILRMVPNVATELMRQTDS